MYILIELMEKVKGKHNGAGADHGGSPRKMTIIPFAANEYFPPLNCSDTDHLARGS